MNKTYSVFSANRQPAPVNATLANGAVVQATVDSLEVQLTPTDGASGTIKLVFSEPAQITQAEEFFTDGKSVVLTFSEV